MKYFLSVLIQLGIYITSAGQTIQPSGTATYCAGASVTLTVNGAAAGANYQWKKDGVNVGTNSSTYNANTDGSYTVVVSGIPTPVTLGPVVVTSTPNPVANFDFSPAGQCSNIPVTFTNLSSGASSYVWNFGDPNSSSNTSTSQNPVHTFIGTPGNASQSLNVELIAKNGAGCTASKILAVTTKQSPDGTLGGTGKSVYNGEIYFKTCGVLSGNFTFSNQSSTLAINTNYRVIWDDGTPDFTSPSFSSLTHTFSVGTHTFLFIVTGNNDCIDTTKYFAFVGTNPAVGLENPGNTTICTGEALTFPITGTATNAPGTTYTVTLNDGSPPIVYIHPNVPPSITHIFDNTSCGTTNSNGTNTYINSFSASIVASNPCLSSAATVVPIHVSKKPVASFTITPGDTACVNMTTTFTNTSENSYVDNEDCLNGNSVWSISPTTGWNLTSGSNFGNDFASPDPSVWQNGSTNLSVIFTVAGVYTIKIKTGNTIDCGTDEITRTICITTPPVPSFDVNNIGCSPFTVSVTNTTTSLNNCGPPTYEWSVGSYTPAFCGTTESWNFASGSTNTSIEPGFVFTNPGIYTITQKVISACGPSTTSRTVSVKKPPEVSIALPSYPCGPVTITPAASVTACGIDAPTYLWTFADGSVANSPLQNPGAVTFTTLGNHAITLAVTNECGTTTVSENVIVSAAPDVIVPSNQSICSGTLIGPLNFTSTVGTPIYNWTNNNPSIGLSASGTGNIAAFTSVNTGPGPVTATITVTPFISASCNGIPSSFTITVNPQPAVPVAITSYDYCLNAAATPLSATPAAGNTLTWYSNSSLSGGTAIAPIPSTTTANTTLYYVTQTNSFGCVSDPAIIIVNVNFLITGNAISADQGICANTIPAALISGNTGGGSGNFSYQWQSSSDLGANWTNIPGATGSSYLPPALTVTTQYRRIVISAPCTDTSNIVTITVQGALANYDIAADQIICEGATPALLTGEAPTGGGGSYTYTWESSIDNLNWSATGVTTPDYLPPALLQTTYFRRKVFASQCNAISSVVIINVNPLPNGAVDATNSSVCEYEAAGILFTATAGTAPFNIELTLTRPANADTIILQTITGNSPATINMIPANSAPGTYTIILAKITDSKGCVRAGNISTTSILVKPRPALITSAAPTICSGNSTQPITVSGADSYNWSPPAGLSNTTGNTITANPAVTTTYTITGTLNGCENTTTITVTVTPGATIASTGPAKVLCNVAAATLSANTPVIGTGSWLQLSGPAALITDPLQSNAIVTGLTGGQRYIFQWTITGVAPCPATNSNDTIDVLSAIVNTIKNDTVICLGQSVTLQTQALSGGNTNGLNAQYSYEWEAASPGLSNWQLVPGAIDEILTVSPAVSTCYRRKVRSNNSCETISNSTCITVNPTIGNNIISAIQQVCVNNVPGNLTGATPTGGDNIYVYQWQTSDDEINWRDVGSNADYQPAAYTLAGVHYFRRNVTSGNCTAASNIITITARPDSKALFTANPLVGCSPFDLGKAITVTALPDSNDLYLWYANDSLFGSNNTGTFPGYTILNSADTIIIKLKTTSPYGCRADSAEQQFITVITAQAKFTKDNSFGCGPLPVTFTNTSSLLNGIQFLWDFGNGIASDLAQPAVVIFNSSPFFNDTTYRVILKAYNGCDTTIWADSVKVRSNPKARFGVDTTFGCSPFTVNIDNTSPGGPNTYYWDFGNGVRDTTYTNSIFNFTYNIGQAVDTFTIRLIAENECGRDTQRLDVRIAPNPIRPLINVNSSQLFGCTPHIVSFNNNTSGATGYTWNFGDGTDPVITNNNQSTITHTYTDTGTFTVQVNITNGCSDTTVFRQVTVFARPLAAFTTNATGYCAGDTVRVINTSQEATNYRWFWGDGTSSTGLNPTHVFTIAGNYNILLRAERTNNTGLVCLDTLLRPVTILAKPVVTVQSNINTVNCAPFTLNVTAPGIINETATWYFYDSTVAPLPIIISGSIAQYTFNKPGTFSLKLVAINTLGCTDSTIIPFTVRGKAVASFTPANLAVCTRDTTISYINTSTYDGIDPISYKWIIDNALVSTAGNLTRHYSVLPGAVLPKTYTTSLIVSNSVGCSDTATATLQMNPTAEAWFNITNQNECVPFVPVIVNTSANASSYKWIVNGNTVSNTADPGIFITQGSTLYTISLVADNIYGCKPDTFTLSFTSRARPAAAFRLSDTLGCTGILNVGTTNLTTGAGSYTWNWGDGTPNSFFTNPTHLYNTPGQYLVTLVASDGVCRDTTEQLVKVSIKPVVDFAVDQTLTCDTARVQFTNLSVNGSDYTWSFGDGTFSTAVNPFKSYAPRNFAYTIKLVASSSLGCKDSAVKANLVLAKVPPASDFLISPSPVITVPSYTFNFNNLTLNSSNYKYLWSLGDGTFATTRDVTHKYTDTGNYPIRLIVLDTVTNCPDTTTKIARIDGFPGYLYVPNAICPACIQTNLREFLPKGAGLKEYRLQIFTTWNELIFETKTLDSKGSPTQSWDGKFKGSIVQQDVYVWRIDAVFLNGSEWLGMIYPGEGKYKKVGTITVVK